MKLANGCGAMIGVTSVLAGCVSGDYTPPMPSSVQNEIIVSQGFDETWNDLIGYASRSFFGIENFEKESGLLTLSFGSGDPAEFIDCGVYNVTAGASSYHGPYATYLQQALNATLTGKMNLRVASLSPSQSRVSVNARYVFSSPPHVVGAGAFATRVPSVTWVSDSLTSDTKVVQNSGDQDTTTRTCRPTGKAERNILEALQMAEDQS